MIVREMDNTCIICGNVIPEGKQYCPTCGTTESDIFGKLMGRKQEIKQAVHEEFKVKDELEQAYRQGFNEGFKHACELKQENERLKRENTILRGKIEAENRIDDVDSFYE